jgi:SOS-response transcriptional repressor LexA
MSQPPVKSTVYLKFLNLVQALREMPTFPVIDATEERLLHQLAAAWNDGKQVTVLEAMKLEAETSPTTIHRRLKSLRKKGIISLTVDEIDNRVKYVSPTALATEYFDQLSHCLVAATKK